jgi:TatD DNase family protein
MFIDTHCHLNFSAFDKDLDDVIKKAKESGVAKIIIPGAKIDSSEKAAGIANIYEGIFAAVGLHPHHIDEYIVSGKKTISEKLAILISNKKIVAIGEAGLDYYQYKGCPVISEDIKEKQKELLFVQLKIAVENNLPVILHSRNSHNDLINLIEEFIINHGKLTGVFHCFTGEKKHLKKIIDLGFYVGFDGNITYPENNKLREIVSIAPLDRLLLETDSPYLTPNPYRNKRNEPSYLINTAEFIASLHNVSLKIIERRTNQNAINLFHI